MSLFLIDFLFIIKDPILERSIGIRFKLSDDNLNEGDTPAKVHMKSGDVVVLEVQELYLTKLVRANEHWNHRNRLSRNDAHGNG